ncbi:MAG: hypothetical protein NT012_00070 [Candidatus Nealsonbacteria bacterium]|nr:hypothetical protein [Candidatus Nealsonbacteria bacterium]
MSKTKSLALIFGVLTMSFLVGYLVFAWTEPGVAPTGGNVPAPINVGSTAQTKTGSLTFPIFYDSDNNAYYVNPAGTTVLAGNVGIGTTSPGAKLEVAGQIKITGGIPGVGKALISDAAGLASWQTITGTLPSGSSGQTLRNDGTNWVANSVIYNNGTNVGIGTAAPGYKLDISGDVRWTGTLQGGSVPWARLTSFPSACSSGQYVTAVGSTLTCSVPPAGIGGSGTTNYLVKFTAGTTIGNSQIYDSGTNVGIGTAAPGAKLEVAGQVKITGGSPAAGKVLTSDAAGLAIWQTPAPAGGTPTGGIIMYSGAWNFDGTGLGTGSLAGWALCNGNNGTPNLSDRFVMGTINSATLGATGGANSYTLTASQLPSHTHTFTTDTSGCHVHTITINSAGAHTHSIASVYAYGTPYSCSSNGVGCCSAASTAKYFAAKSTSPSLASAASAGDHSHTSSMSTCGAHSHSGTTDSAGSGASIDNRPAFIQLAFIMKL